MAARKDNPTPPLPSATGDQEEKFDRTVEISPSATPSNDSPTRETYAAIEEAYNHFNLTLFKGRLPPCLTTFPTSRRFMGYFAHNRFISSADGRVVPEIAINALFSGGPVRDLLSTLVHEMVHYEQQLFGKPGEHGYHNKQFSRLMERVGLICSHTGKPGGRKTGVGMSDYVEEGGRFDAACAELVAKGWRLPYVQRPPLLIAGPEGKPSAEDQEKDKEKERKRASKTKFTCACPNNAWGKPNLRLRCEDCGHLLVQTLRRPGAGS